MKKNLKVYTVIRGKKEVVGNIYDTIDNAKRALARYKKVDMTCRIVQLYAKKLK